MNSLQIEGGYPLKGKVVVSGCKNTALAVLPAVLLAKGTIILKNVPDIVDVQTMVALLRDVGVDVEYLDKHVVKFAVGDDIQWNIKSLKASSIRGSLFLLGPILARMGHIALPYPGGCNIGTRPIDLHEKGLRILGYDIETTSGYIYGRRTRDTKGDLIYFDFPSVGATENLLMAAALTPGYTVIENAAIDPQVVSLSAFLNRIGVKISGIGTRKLVIEGRQEPYEIGTIEWTIPGDYLEAGTFMLYAAGIKGSEVHITPAYRGFLIPLIAKLEDMGITLVRENGGITVYGSDELIPVRIKTLPFPGFPTDLQPIIGTLLTQAHGESVVQELVHDRRLGYVNYLLRMGADITTLGQSTAIIRGRTPLFGTDVKAENLRAGAALILAGLLADGTTIVKDMYHVYRGYEDIVGKLQTLGAHVQVIAGES